jgi:hypothetical protein
MNQGFAPQVRHRLLLPEDVRFVREVNAAEREAARRYLPPVWDDAGEPDSVVWRSVLARDVDPEETLQCLWEFVRLPEDAGHRIPKFVQTWGLLEWGPGSELATREKEQSFSDWIEAAEEAERLLKAFVMTEQGALVPESLLWDLREGDRREYYSYDKEYEARPVSPEEVHVLTLTRQRDYFETERRAGRGVALQRELIVNLLGEIVMPPDARHSADDRASEGEQTVPLLFGYSWDDRGRRVEARASGVREIVASHLLSIFGSSQPDVFICSVCGTPFSTESAQTQRRPRAGVKRLCSEACRLEAKRESNRASWNKNKDRWRPSSVTKGGTGVRQTRKR